MCLWVGIYRSHRLVLWTIGLRWWWIRIMIILGRFCENMGRVNSATPSVFWGNFDTKPLFLFYKGEVNKTIEYKKDNTTKISYMNVDSNQLFYIEAVRKTRLVDFLLTFHNIQVFILLKSWITIKNSYAIDHSALKISIPQFCMVCNSLCCIMM